MKQTIYQEKGMSIVELLVALTILATALTPLLALFLQSLKVSDKANKMMLAANLARDLGSEIRSLDFWDPDIAYDEDARDKYFPRREDVPQPFGLELSAGESFSGSRLQSFDDVDDYDGWCRGKDCDCTGVPAGVCVEDTELETFDGDKYDGSKYPKYAGFTRSVKVMNIFPNELVIQKIIFRNWSTKEFKFFDFRPEVLPNLTSVAGVSAKGRTRLKIVTVNVKYTGSVAPGVNVDDVNLLAMPFSED